MSKSQASPTEEQSSDLATVDLAGCLAQGTFEFWITSATGIVCKDEIPEERWRIQTQNVAMMFEATGKKHAQAAMMLGDLLRFGEEKFGERYAQVVDATREYMRVSAKTLENWTWIATKIDPSRRRENLDLETHNAVAKLPPAEQNEFLRMAENDGLSASELRKEIKKVHPGKPRASKATTVCKIDTTKPAAIGGALEILAGHFGKKDDAGAFAEILDDWEPHLAILEKAFRRLQRQMGKKR